MEEFTIELFEVADSGTTGQFRARDDKGRRFPQLLIDDGVKSQVKAKLMAAVHGSLTPGGDPASLLIFEFNITAQNSSRFTRAVITATFEDGSGPSANDPEVHEIAPSGLYALNKKTDEREVTHEADAAVNASPVAGTGFNLGYHWTMSGIWKKSHSAKLNGMARKVKTSGEETTAMWIMEEDPVDNEGIPSFLRTAVILRHDPDECGEFRLHVEIDAERSRSFFYGKSTLSKMLKPLELDPRVIAAAEKGGVKTDDIDGLKLDDEFVVRMARVLNL